MIAGEEHPTNRYGRLHNNSTNAIQVAPKLVELAVQTFGKLDGIVINHGVLSPMKRIVDSNIQDWKHIYDANIFSAVALVCRTLNPRLT